MSQCIVPPCLGSSFRVSGPAVRLVVATGVQNQRADQFPVLGDHANPQTIDENDHPDTYQLPSETYVMQLRVMAEGDHPGDIDLVSPHPVMTRYLYPR